MEANDKNQEKVQMLPPYMPFKTFLNFIEKLKEYPIVPQRIDPVTLRGYSGAVQRMLISTLKSVNLIDKDRMVTDVLRALVKNYKTSDWAPLLKKIISDRYADVIGSLDISDATRPQLEEKFRAVGADRDVLTKCIAFYVSAMKEAEIPISPHITVERRGRPTLEQSRKKNIKPDGGKKQTQTDQNHTDVIVPGTVQFNIPILPGKAPVKIVVPENISKEEWKMVNDTMDGYISLIEIQGKKEQK